MFSIQKFREALKVFVDSVGEMPQQVHLSEAQIIDLVNESRRAEGLPPVYHQLPSHMQVDNIAVIKCDTTGPHFVVFEQV